MKDSREKECWKEGDRKGGKLVSLLNPKFSFLLQLFSALSVERSFPTNDTLSFFISSMFYVQWNVIKINYKFQSSQGSFYGFSLLFTVFVHYIAVQPFFLQ